MARQKSVSRLALGTVWAGNLWRTSWLHDRVACGGGASTHTSEQLKSAFYAALTSVWAGNLWRTSWLHDRVACGGGAHIQVNN